MRPSLAFMPALGSTMKRLMKGNVDEGMKKRNPPRYFVLSVVLDE